MIILEEAHNLLLKKSVETKESVLENSIRMVRQYGLGYVFVDQSASLLSKVAFANSYATIALSQKLRSDIQTISGAMNLSEEQRDALSTLPIGSAVVRLADEHPEAFLVKIARCPIKEGSVTDKDIRLKSAGYYTDTSSPGSGISLREEVSPVPAPDKNKKISHNTKGNNTHPPSPRESREKEDPASLSIFSNLMPEPPPLTLSREEIRFLFDVIARPLSTTVSRYQRLNLSRRRGHAINRSLVSADILERVTIATSSGQVVLYQLTDSGRSVCKAAGIDPGPKPCDSLEHQFWINKAAEYYEGKNYEVAREHPIKDNGVIDLLAEKSGEKIAIEVETGKSNIKTNFRKIMQAGFDRIVIIATSPTAVSACQKVANAVKSDHAANVLLLTWLDIS